VCLEVQACSINLSHKLQVFKGLRGEGKLTAENMESAPRAIDYTVALQWRLVKVRDLMRLANRESSTLQAPVEAQRCHNSGTPRR
jgi:hypothetical protein